MKTKQLVKIVENLIEITNDIESSLKFQVVDSYTQSKSKINKPILKKFNEFKYDQKKRLAKGELVQYADNGEKLLQQIESKQYKIQMIRKDVFHQASLLNTILGKDGVKLQATEKTTK